MKHISVGAFKEILNTSKDHSKTDFINVCTPAEYKEKHIQGVRNVPLSDLEDHLNEFKNKEKIYVHCRSGNRSQKAIAILEAYGVAAELVNVSGGLLSWESEGFQTASVSQKRIPIMRQVLFFAGVFILLSHVLSIAVHPQFIWISFVVGCGLLFAGSTGWCGMAYVLAKMPWNK